MNDLKHSYSDGISKKKIAVLGPYPPPLGGISVHIQRVIKKYGDQHNCVKHFDTTVEYRYRFLLFYVMRLAVFIVCVRPDIVDYHTLYIRNSTLELWVLAFFKRILKYKIILIEHDCRHLYQRIDRFKKKLNVLFKSVDKHICIGDRTYKSYHDNRIILPAHTTIEAAFLPPDYSRETQILRTYPETLFIFIQQHNPLIIVNAFQLSFLEGKDLYGIDLCVTLMSNLKRIYPSIGLIVFLAQIGNECYLKRLRHMITVLELDTNIYIMHGQKELWPMLKRADLFVRPTLSDGASVSIVEALCLGVPVIASDVCIRPKGTDTFVSGDVADFTKKVEIALKRKYYEFGNK